MFVERNRFCTGIHGPVAQPAKLIARRENALLNLTVPNQAQIIHKNSSSILLCFFLFMTYSSTLTIFLSFVLSHLTPTLARKKLSKLYSVPRFPNPFRGEGRGQAIINN